MRTWSFALVVAAALALPAPALAGRVIVTGHAPDARCATAGEQCRLLRTLVDYVRETAPRPRRPILVVDRGPARLRRALVAAWGDAYGPPMKRVNPSGRAWRRARLTTRRWSAIAIASGSAAGGSIRPRDSRAITRRSRAIARFLNAGGGIVALAGGARSRGYYSFLPLPRARPAGPGPFTVTPYGARIGIAPEDVNCCRVFNTFSEPAVGEMAIAARNEARAGDTLIADGRVRRGRLVADRTIPPEPGASIVVEPVRGRVLGHPPDDPRFRPITGAANLVVGWTLDVKQGAVRLTTAANARGRRQSAQVYEGVFQVLQEPGPAPVTDLALRGGRFDSICGTAARGAATRGGARAAAVARVVRRLWGKGRGRFRTVGRFASAAVRGTQWLTEDRCDGTLVRVVEGLVGVFDVLLGREVLVRAGRSYLARAP